MSGVAVVHEHDRSELVDEANRDDVPGHVSQAVEGVLRVERELDRGAGVRGLDLIGCDLVEISPPYDLSGNTSLVGANLLFEMLCVLPGVMYRN